MEMFHKSAKHFLTLISLLLVTLLVSCGGKSSSSSEESVTSEITAQAGGAITLPQVGTATFAPGVLEASTTTTLSKVTNPVVKDAFTDSAIMFASKVKSSFELEIKLGIQQPQNSVTVQLFVPEELRKQATASDELRLMYLNNWQDEDETLNTVEMVETRGKASDNSITGNIPREAFSLNAQGQYAAHVFLALTPTAPSIKTALNLGLQNLLTAINPIGSALAADDKACNGSTLQSPVDESITITSRFGPRNVAGNPKASKNHSGIDYGAKAGTEVKAAADGVVEEIRVRTADGTYGYHIVLSHPGVGKTLYAHLQTGSEKFKKGKLVKAGDVIALSGATGTKKEHLHFEYAPEGNIFIKDNKQNPEPCMQKLASGSLTIKDNGAAADDSFRVTLDGRKICETTIGQANSCTLGALRPNTYTLGVTVLVAPDDVGTYEITITAPNMTIDGGTSASGAPVQGATENHVLKVEPSSIPLTLP